MVPATELVPGDLLVLGPGDRVAADARVVRSRGLAVDEAPLSGESFPLSKLVDAGPAEGRIVLDGTDVTSGWGRALAFAVGGVVADEGVVCGARYLVRHI